MPDQASASAAVVQQQAKSPREILAALDTLCLYRIEDWWTYELCYKRSVRQVHGISALSSVCSHAMRPSLICAEASNTKQLLRPEAGKQLIMSWLLSF